MSSLNERKQSNDHITCPECNRRHLIQIDLLPTDSSLQTKVKINELITKKESHPSCGVCNRSKIRASVGYCQQCQSFVCQSCSEAHQYMKQFSNHVVVKIEQFNAQMVKPNAICCSEHKNELINRYCGKCKQAICRECMLGRHYKHQFLTLDSAKKEVLDSMPGLQEELVAKLKIFEQHLGQIKMMEAHLTQYSVHLIAQVNSSCDQALKNIESARTKLTSDIERIYSDYAAKVNAERETVERTILTLRSSIAFTQRLLDSSNDIETLVLSTHANGQLTEVKHSTWNEAAIKLPSLMFKVEMPVAVGNIVEFDAQQSMSITARDGADLTVGTPCSIIFQFKNDTEIPKALPMTLDVKVAYCDPKFLAKRFIPLPANYVQLSNFNIQENNWIAMVTWLSEGDHQLEATISVYGKVFGTLHAIFQVKSSQRKPCTPKKVLM